MITFNEWIKQYDSFKAAVKAVVTSEIPDEVTELIRENQMLPKLLNAAQEHRAMAAFYHQGAKEKKQPLAQVLWAKEDSAGLASVLKSRCIAVSVALRPDK